MPAGACNQPSIAAASIASLRRCQTNRTRSAPPSAPDPSSDRRAADRVPSPATNSSASRATVGPRASRSKAPHSAPQRSPQLSAPPHRRSAASITGNVVTSATALPHASATFRRHARVAPALRPARRAAPVRKRPSALRAIPRAVRCSRAKWAIKLAYVERIAPMPQKPSRRSSRELHHLHQHVEAGFAVDALQRLDACETRREPRNTAPPRSTRARSRAARAPTKSAR